MLRRALRSTTKCQYLCFLLGKTEGSYGANFFFVAMLHAAVMVKKKTPECEKSSENVNFDENHENIADL